MPELRTEVYRFSEARVSDFWISIREGKKNAENVDWCLREKIGIPRKIGDFTALISLQAQTRTGEYNTQRGYCRG